MGDIPASVHSAPSYPVVVSSAPLKPKRISEDTPEPKRNNIGSKHLCVAATGQGLGRCGDSSQHLDYPQPPSLVAGSSQDVGQDQEKQSSGMNARQVRSPYQHMQFHYPPQRQAAFHTAAGFQPATLVQSGQQQPPLIHSHSAPAALQQPQQFQLNPFVIGYPVPQQLPLYASSSGAPVAATSTNLQTPAPAQGPHINYYAGSYSQPYYAPYGQPYSDHYPTHHYPSVVHSLGYSVLAVDTLRRHSHPSRTAQSGKRRSSGDYIASAYRWNQPTVGTPAPPLTSAPKIDSHVLRASNFGTDTTKITTGTGGLSNTSEFSHGTSEQQSDYSAMLSSHSLPPTTYPQRFTSFLPRGPPRKPRQSGYALWVGNLPPGTTVVELKDHFSTDFVKEIESVFLISKSNCAFVNYKSEESVQKAMEIFPDKRFKGVRLVCRMRRASASGAGHWNVVPKGGDDREASQMIGGGTRQEDITSKDGEVATRANSDSGSEELKSESPLKEAEEDAKGANTAQILTTSSTFGSVKWHGDRPGDRIFIVKSLTMEDLDLSVKNGVWATQSHNEEVFNRAFESSENVYLIFSANKSGEYYGYARMVSRIEDTTPVETGERAITGSPSGITKTTDDGTSELQHQLRESEETPQDTSIINVATTSATQSKLQQQPQIHPHQQLPKPSLLSLPKTIFTSATVTAPAGRIIDDSARGTIFWEVIEEHEIENHDGNDFTEDDVATDLAGGGEISWGKPFRVEWVSTTRVPFYRTRGLRNAWNGNREVKIARDGTEVETGVGKRLLALFGRGNGSVGGNTAGAGAAEIGPLPGAAGGAGGGQGKELEQNCC